MESLFESEKFAERLQKCPKIVQICDERWDPAKTGGTTRKRGSKFIDADGIRVAVIFYYDQTDGTVLRSLRMLRVGDVTYHANP